MLPLLWFPYPVDHNGWSCPWAPALTPLSATLRPSASSPPPKWTPCCLNRCTRRFAQCLRLCRFHTAFGSRAWQTPWNWFHRRHPRRRLTWRRTQTLFRVCSLHIPLWPFSDRAASACHHDHRPRNQTLVCRLRRRGLYIQRRWII